MRKSQIFCVQYNMIYASVRCETTSKSLSTITNLYKSIYIYIIYKYIYSTQKIIYNHTREASATHLDPWFPLSGPLRRRSNLASIKSWVCAHLVWALKPIMICVKLSCRRLTVQLAGGPRELGNRKTQNVGMFTWRTRFNQKRLALNDYSKPFGCF